MQPFLESFESHAIGTLDLAVGPWVSDGDIANIDSVVLVVLPELVVVEIRSQVSDDPIREAVAVYDFIQEVENSVSFGTSDRFDLNPFGELVDGDEYSIEPS